MNPLCGCGCGRRVKARHRTYFSKPCSAKMRGRAFYRAAGQKGGRARAENMRPGQLAKFKELSKGLEPWEAFKAGARWQIKRSNCTIYARAIRAGIAKGYEMALADMQQKGAA